MIGSHIRLPQSANSNEMGKAPWLESCPRHFYGAGHRISSPETVEYTTGRFFATHSPPTLSKVGKVDYFFRKHSGVLGDCWLLSAMALIAERPDILMQIFLTREYSPIGAYQLR